jgi:hypothetical protein
MIFLSAALLFWVEPLLGKMVLPLLGGSSVVGHPSVYLFDLLHTGFQSETVDFSQVHGLPATGNPGLHDCRGLVVEPGLMVAVPVKSLGAFCYLYGLSWRIGEAATSA